MSDNLIAELSKLAVREQELAAGMVLFRVGEPVASVFLVISGAMRLTRSLPHGVQLTLQRAASGPILAEASLFADLYHCEATSSEVTVLRVIPRPRIEAALASNLDLARGWVRHLARELQRTRAIAEMISLKTVAERIEAWIALNDGPFPSKGSWRQIASEIGSSPEALYRELARRRSRGFPV